MTLRHDCHRRDCICALGQMQDVQFLRYVTTYLQLLLRNAAPDLQPGCEKGKLTATMGFAAGGWGLQVLSVTLKSDHLIFSGFSFASISGIYSSGSEAALQERQTVSNAKTNRNH